MTTDYLVFAYFQHVTTESTTKHIFKKFAVGFKLVYLDPNQKP